MGADKPFKIELPDAERGRNAQDLARLDVLNGRLSRPAKPRGRKSAADAREEDLAEREKLERQPEIVADQEWLRTSAAETAALAEGRGDEVVRNPSGRLEIVNRDALRRLLNTGKLTPEQFDAGAALRECYEMRSGDAGSQLAELAPSATSHDNHRFVASRYTRAVATGRAQAVELAVLTGGYRLRDGSRLQVKAWEAFKEAGEPPPHVALAVLRKVCADNIGLTALGRGRIFAWNSRALLIALDIAHECLMGNRAKQG